MNKKEKQIALECASNLVGHFIEGTAGTEEEMGTILGGKIAEKNLSVFTIGIANEFYRWLSKNKQN